MSSFGGHDTSSALLAGLQSGDSMHYQYEQHQIQPREQQSNSNDDVLQAHQHQQLDQDQQQEQDEHRSPPPLIDNATTAVPTANSSAQIARSEKPNNAFQSGTVSLTSPLRSQPPSEIFPRHQQHHQLQHNNNNDNNSSDDHHHHHHLFPQSRKDSAVLSVLKRNDNTSFGFGNPAPDSITRTQIGGRSTNHTQMSGGGYGGGPHSTNRNSNLLTDDGQQLRITTNSCLSRNLHSGDAGTDYFPGDSQNTNNNNNNNNNIINRKTHHNNQINRTCAPHQPVGDGTDDGGGALSFPPFVSNSNANVSADLVKLDDNHQHDVKREEGDEDELHGEVLMIDDDHHCCERDNVSATRSDRLLAPSAVAAGFSKSVDENDDAHHPKKLLHPHDVTRLPQNSHNTESHQNNAYYSFSRSLPTPIVISKLQYERITNKNNNTDHPKNHQGTRQQINHFAFTSTRALIGKFLKKIQKVRVQSTTFVVSEEREQEARNQRLALLRFQMMRPLDTSGGIKNANNNTNAAAADTSFLSASRSVSPGSRNPLGGGGATFTNSAIAQGSASFARSTANQSNYNNNMNKNNTNNNTNMISALNTMTTSIQQQQLHHQLSTEGSVAVQHPIAVHGKVAQSTMEEIMNSLANTNNKSSKQELESFREQRNSKKDNTTNPTNNNNSKQGDAPEATSVAQTDAIFSSHRPSFLQVPSSIRGDPRQQQQHPSSSLRGKSGGSSSTYQVLELILYEYASVLNDERQTTNRNSKNITEAKQQQLLTQSSAAAATGTSTPTVATSSTATFTTAAATVSINTLVAFLDSSAAVLKKMSSNNTSNPHNHHSGAELSSLRSSLAAVVGTNFPLISGRDLGSATSAVVPSTPRQPIAASARSRKNNNKDTSRFLTHCLLVQSSTSGELRMLRVPLSTQQQQQQQQTQMMSNIILEGIFSHRSSMADPLVKYFYAKQQSHRRQQKKENSSSAYQQQQQQQPSSPSLSLVRAQLSASPSVFDCYIAADDDNMSSFRSHRYPGWFKPVKMIGQGTYGAAFLVVYNQPPASSSPSRSNNNKSPPQPNHQQQGRLSSPVRESVFARKKRLEVERQRALLLERNAKIVSPSTDAETAMACSEAFVTMPASDRHGRVVGTTKFSRRDLFVCKVEKLQPNNIVTPPASTLARRLADDVAKQHLDRASNEAHILSNIAHPNIIGFVDHVVDRRKQQQLLFIEYVDGGDLTGLIAKRRASRLGPFSESQILDTFVQVVLAVEYLHRNNILHRDIKSGNILMSKHGFVKLADFGLARNFMDVDINTNVDTGMRGTPLYLAPEMWLGESYSEKCDIYSLGIVLYELITSGGFPYKLTSDAGTLDALKSVVLHSNIQPIPRRDISSSLLRLLGCLLDKNPDARPTAKQILLYFSCTKNAMIRYVNGFFDTLVRPTIELPPNDDKSGAFQHKSFISSPTGLQHPTKTQYQLSMSSSMPPHQRQLQQLQQHPAISSGSASPSRRDSGGRGKSTSPVQQNTNNTNHQQKEALLSSSSSRRQPQNADIGLHRILEEQVNLICGNDPLRKIEDAINSQVSEAHSMSQMAKTGIYASTKQSTGAASTRSKGLSQQQQQQQQYPHHHHYSQSAEHEMTISMNNTETNNNNNNNKNYSNSIVVSSKKENNHLLLSHTHSHAGTTREEENQIFVALPSRASTGCSQRDNDDNENDDFGQDYGGNNNINHQQQYNRKNSGVPRAYHGNSNNKNNNNKEDDPYYDVSSSASPSVFAGALGGISGSPFGSGAAAMSPGGTKIVKRKSFQEQQQQRLLANQSGSSVTTTTINISNTNNIFPFSGAAVIPPSSRGNGLTTPTTTKTAAGNIVGNNNTQSKSSNIYVIGNTTGPHIKNNQNNLDVVFNNNNNSEMDCQSSSLQQILAFSQGSHPASSFYDGLQAANGSLRPPQDIHQQQQPHSNNINNNYNKHTTTTTTTSASSVSPPHSPLPPSHSPNHSPPRRVSPSVSSSMTSSSQQDQRSYRAAQTRMRRKKEGVDDMLNRVFM